jgi:hypothetical protein
MRWIRNLGKTLPLIYSPCQVNMYKSPDFISIKDYMLFERYIKSETEREIAQTRIKLKLNNTNIIILIS